MNLQTIKRIFLLIPVIIITCSSCSKFLDKKADKSLVVPATLQDAQALLDFYSLMNSFYPSMGGQSDDDFYILDTYWSGIATVNQDNYIWAKENYNESEWGYMYQVALQANLVLETITGIELTSNNLADYNRIKGSALFYRANAFFQLTQHYTIPYDKSTAVIALGVPLRLTTDISVANTRATQQQTYDKIIADLTIAAAILPANTTPVSRPSKAAAFGLLARTFLTMEDYLHAGLYADSCLQLNNNLLDYKTLNGSITQPFSRFNAEVIFPSNLIAPSMLVGVNNWKVDSLLYKSYDANDLRKTLFYQSNSTGGFGFRGSYDGSGTVFSGITTAEVLLTRAECKARLGDKDGAMADLNTLLEKRWKAGLFIRLTATSTDDALIKILNERRKELVLRGLRWFDLRRLNKDPRFAKTLTRKVNGQLYQLPPGDSRYTFYIPHKVIDLSGIQQNTR
ncbi:MAG: RagB/SusD family nutrient uptake outer membrane protein [Chitinophagaceae bacterium]|nr:RagB/SusD family nutrient uptake outer membrane protein [Chitinophagaceae bacterium]